MNKTFNRLCILPRDCIQTALVLFDMSGSRESGKLTLKLTRSAEQRCIVCFFFLCCVTRPAMVCYSYEPYQVGSHGFHGIYFRCLIISATIFHFILQVSLDKQTPI